MVIAVPYVQGMISDHFGRTECFKIYETGNGEVVSEKLVQTEGVGHFYMVQFLVGLQVDTVLCKGMGEPSRKALEIAGIQVVLTEKSEADQAVRDLLL